jgi:hypothetical protein
VRGAKGAGLVAGGGGGPPRAPVGRRAPRTPGARVTGPGGPREQGPGGGARRLRGAHGAGSIAGLAGALAVGLLTSGAAWAGQAGLQPRVPAAFLVVTPPGVSGRASASDLMAAAAEALGARTHLELRSLEQLGVDQAALDACQGSAPLSCWARVVRGLGGAAAPRYALVAALQPAGPELEQVTLLLMDLEDAARRLDAAPAGDRDAAAQVEDALFAVTPRAPPVRLDLARPEVRKAAFADALADHFQPALTDAGHWGGLGRVRVQDTLRGWAVTVDGAPAGVTTPVETVLDGAPEGERRVGVAVPWDPAFVAPVTVRAGAEAWLRIPPAPPPLSRARVGVRYGGLAVAAAGLAVLGYGVARAHDGAQVTCLRRPGDAGDCAGLGTPSTGYDPARIPATDPAAVDAGGLAILPLGAALAVAGGGASAWAWLESDEAAFPWWPLAVGLVAGGLTYGVGHAVGR